MNASTSSNSASPRAATTHEWVVRCVTCASLSRRIQNSPCIAVPGAAKTPTIANGSPATSRVSPRSAPRTLASASGPAAISSAPRCGQRPRSRRTCGCTAKAMESKPRTRTGGASLAGAGAAALGSAASAIGSATWISPETAGSPANRASPSTSAASAVAVEGGISLRSTLSSLPAPRTSAFVASPVEPSACSMPRANATAARMRNETIALPATTSASRFGDRARLRIAWSKGRSRGSRGIMRPSVLRRSTCVLPRPRARALPRRRRGARARSRRSPSSPTDGTRRARPPHRG